MENLGDCTPSRVTGEKARRELLSPPSSGEKEGKKQRTGETGKEARSPTMSNRVEIQEAILTRMNEALAKDLTPPGKEKSAEGESEIARILQTVLPAIATAIAVGVEEVMTRCAAVAREEQSAKDTHKDALYASIRRLTYDNDKLQQYSRRESVRVFGIPTEANETNEKVEEETLKVMRETGADIQKVDISTCHRVGKTRNGTRPIIVRFVSRRKRLELMRAKKNLKAKENMSKVFINDDLTPLRSKLLGYVKGLDIVERAWTMDGRIYCVKKAPAGLPADKRPPTVVVESPDDLFELGVDDLDYGRLGLTHIAFADHSQT